MNTPLKQCEIEGAVRVKGMSNADLKDPSRESGFTTVAINNAPTNIVFDSITITGLGRNPFYLGAGVTYSKLINSEIKGKSNAVAIYLDHESGWNTIKNNYIHVDTPDGGLFGTKVGKPQIAIDGSTHNKILNNTFSALNNGGIELYRNCGERGVVRHQKPSHNQIINNIFYYNKYTGGSPAVYLGSRDANWLIDYCWEDEFERVWEWDGEGSGGYKYTKIDSNLFGSADSDLDYARHNVVMQNQIYKRKIFNSDLDLVNATLDDLIKTRNRSVNSPNYIENDKGDAGVNVMVTTEDSVKVGIDEWAKRLSWLRINGNPRLAGCYVSNEAEKFVLHGQPVNSGSPHYRFVCNNGDLVTIVPAPPKLLTPNPGAIISSGAVTFTGEHKGATQHWMWVGTTPGKFDIVNTHMGTETAITVNIPISLRGKEIYIRYWSTINGTFVFTDHTYSVNNGYQAFPTHDPKAKF